MRNKYEALKNGACPKYQRCEGIIQPKVERQRLNQLEEERMIEFDRIGRDVFLHSMFTSAIRVWNIKFGVGFKFLFVRVGVIQQNLLGF